MRLSTLGLLIGCLSAAPCAFGVDAVTLARDIEGLRVQHGIAATALVLIDQAQAPLIQVTGVRGWKDARPVDPDTRFRVGSITKTFTALALLRAEAQNHVQLDRPLREWMPRASYENPWEATHPLTLTQLLEHTAGWPDMSPAEFDSSDPRPLDLDAALALRPASRTSLWPPGLHHQYSNSGAGLAAWVLQQSTGRSFESHAQDQVFAPLGMKTASLVADDATRAHLAQGYDADGRKPLPYWHILYRAAGGLNLAPRDMAPLLRMFLDRGKVGRKDFLKPEQLARMERSRSTLGSRAGLEAGYGLGLRRSLHRGHALYGHGGDADGYLSQFSYSVDSGRAYFVVITAFDGEAVDDMQSRLDDWLVESLTPVAAEPAVSLTAAQLKALTGDYFAAATRFPAPGWERRKRVVRVRDGQLETFAPDGAAVTLLALDAQHFRKSSEKRVGQVFMPQPDGSIVLQGSLGNWRKPPVSQSGRVDR